MEAFSTESPTNIHGAARAEPRGQRNLLFWYVLVLVEPLGSTDHCWRLAIHDDSRSFQTPNPENPPRGKTATKCSESLRRLLGSRNVELKVRLNTGKATKNATSSTINTRPHKHHEDAQVEP